MKDVFLYFLNMSITASYVILFVILFRMLLKKAPRIFSYCLWSVVLFRLICPFSFSSVLSIFRFFNKSSMEHIPVNTVYVPQPRINSGMNVVNYQAGNPLPASIPAAGVDPIQIILYVLSFVWIAGVIGLLIYSCVSYIRLKRRVCTAILVSDNIFKCEKIKSPFVLGIIKPKIYLPSSLTENEEGYILMHEQIHIKRFDYLIKPFAFLVLCIHWFNPLVWIAFVLMSRDMEMSCDEGVLRKMGNSIKKEYSSSILALSFDRRMLNGSPLAFGESNTKGRIKNVLYYKKPGLWMISAAVILVCAAGIGLAANPKEAGISGVGFAENIKEDKQKTVALLTANETEASEETRKYLIDNLTKIMASPKQSSNPDDYIKENRTYYENILKKGEESLNYILSEFQNGNVKNDLQGQIMMKLCKELLGERNNVTDETLLPTEWYSKLSIRQKIELPDFTYEGSDPLKRLVYSTEIEMHKASRGEFTIIAPHIFGSYEEGDRLKVFVTTFSKHYYLYDKTLYDEGGAVIPAAITYVKDASGNYALEKYEQTKDGSEFAPSIKKFCVMPVSGDRIDKLADKILEHYGNSDELIKLERENLIEHLKKCNQNGVFLLQRGYQKPDELIPLT